MSKISILKLRTCSGELGTNEILLQSQLYLLNQRVDLIQDRPHCTPSPRSGSSSSFPSNSTSLSSSTSHISTSAKTSLDLSLSLLLSGDGFVD